MKSKPTLVASDAHLGATPARSRRAFLEFLQHVPERTDDLLLVGDVFDFWFEYRTVVLREYFPVLRILAGLVEEGVRIRLVGGNHDAWGGSFLRDELGLELVDGPAVTDVGGRRSYVAHGDGLASGDLGYRIFKRVSRSRPARTLFRLLPPDVTVPMVRRLSRTEAKARGKEKGMKTRARALRRHALQLLRDRGDLQLVIFGHSHHPELREVAEGRYYLNTGDWIRHFTYAVVGAGQVELRRWKERAPVG